MVSTNDHLTYLTCNWEALPRAANKFMPTANTPSQWWVALPPSGMDDRDALDGLNKETDMNRHMVGWRCYNSGFFSNQAQQGQDRMQKTKQTRTLLGIDTQVLQCSHRQKVTVTPTSSFLWLRPFVHCAFLPSSIDCCRSYPICHVHLPIILYHDVGASQIINNERGSAIIVCGGWWWRRLVGVVICKAAPCALCWNKTSKVGNYHSKAASSSMEQNKVR